MEPLSCVKCGAPISIGEKQLHKGCCHYCGTHYIGDFMGYHPDAGPDDTVFTSTASIKGYR